MIRQNTLLGTGLTAVFSIVTYILYVHQLVAATDPLAIVLLALIYFVPGMVEMIEEVQSGHEHNRFLFWIKIFGVLMSLGYIGILWYLISQYSSAFLNGLPAILRTLIIALPSVFLVRKVFPLVTVIIQLNNKNSQ